MSSKRGRKRNDNLPPNRARDVQRAFRARRAAHLEALEQRVADLEDENARFRIALGLPPANRAPLGKGPTGKDKPKSDLSKGPHDVSALLSSMSANGVHPPLSRTESPLSAESTSGQSMSPDPTGSALSLAPASSPALDPSAWDSSMFAEKSSSASGPLPSTSYLPPPSSLAPYPHVPRSASHDMYPSNQNYPQDSDKYGYLLEDERRYSYSYPLLSGQSTPSPLPPPSGDAAYLQRRIITTDQDGYRPLLPHSHGDSPSHQQNGASVSHVPRIQSAPISVDANYDVPGGAERRYTRLH